MDLRELIRNLPNEPGVYRYYDSEGAILYIGKARDLKKRVSSYFTTRTDTSERIRLMVGKIVRIEYTVVPTEYDALLLENNLIKKFQPRYNVSLKDGKTYPFLCIKKERFPRLFLTRQPERDGSEYFGPYASVLTVRNVLDLVRKLFPTRSCSYNLSEQNIAAHKFRVCLDYHIHLCKGPCEGFQSEEEYNQNISLIRKILRGHTGQVKQYLEERLEEAVASLRFEDAQAVKERLELLERYRSKSTVVSTSIDNVDVFSFFSNEDHAYVNYLRVVNGAIIATDTVEYRKRMQEEDADILSLAMVELREKYGSTAKEVLVPFTIELKPEGFKLNVPQNGDRKRLLDMSKQNVFAYFQDRLNAKELNKEKRQNTELLNLVKNDLGLKQIPYHIECIDNSNIQGSFPVSSVVVFKNGQPSKKDYRIFNIKTVEGPDDFATMEEVVTRRYRRMIEENQPLPQLIIIDGGKGQLHSAITSLERLGIADKLDAIGIAKRLEEIYKPGDALPLSINKKSPALKLIQRARDEAHRFGLSRHRNRRVKSNLRSSLEEIPGIGEKTARKLLTHFKSIKKIKEATPEELEKVLGKVKARLVQESLSKD